MGIGRGCLLQQENQGQDREHSRQEKDLPGPGPGPGGKPVCPRNRTAESPNPPAAKRRFMEDRVMKEPRPTRDLSRRPCWLRQGDPRGTPCTLQES
jgi:hypothetical protein